MYCAFMQQQFMHLMRGLTMVVVLMRAILMHKAVPDGDSHTGVYFTMFERFQCCPAVQSNLWQNWITP